MPDLLEPDEKPQRVKGKGGEPPKGGRLRRLFRIAMFVVLIVHRFVRWIETVREWFEE